MMFLICALVGAVVLLTCTVAGMIWSACAREKARDHEISAVWRVLNNHTHTVWREGTWALAAISSRRDVPHVRTVSSARGVILPAEPQGPVRPLAETEASDRVPTVRYVSEDDDATRMVLDRNTLVSARGGDR